MEETPEPVKTRDEIFSSLLEIVGHIERLMDYLIGKRRDEAGWLGVLATILVLFFGVIGVIMVNFLADNYATKYFIGHLGSNIIYFGFLLVLSLPIGLITYFYAKKRYVEEYTPWKNALNGLKKTVTESKAEEISIIETTLQLMDQTSTWFLDVMKYKSEEALMYGFIAFLFTTFISANSPVGVPIASLIGVIVWLYFRYEKRKEAAQQIQTFKTWRKKFEEGKDYFLKSV